MVEDIGLNVFVLHPGGGVGKTVYFDRHAAGFDGELAHHYGHVLVYASVFAQVVFDVMAEGSQVGHGSPIHGNGAVKIVFTIELLNFLLAPFDIIF